MAVYTQKYHAMIKMTEQMDEIGSKRDDIAFENQGLVYGAGGGTTLEEHITFDDPKTFSKSWEALKAPGVR